jgi:transposase
MEASMKRAHFIGMDVHSQFCELAVVNAAGQLVSRERCVTTIVALRAALESVPKPRQLVIEEGPLAGWLWRNLKPVVEGMVVSEPRRNRLIAQDGDKDDDLDAEKLALLLRGGYLKEVHQTATVERAAFKQLVALYHHRVRQRVREAHRTTSLLRQHGVVVRERHYVAAADRPTLLRQLPENGLARSLVTTLWANYDAAVEQEQQWRRRLVQAARKEEVVRRLVELPGVSWIRAATLYAYLDTPWRFRSKAALWKYLGIGLERKRSGSGPERLGVLRQAHRLLKGTILGAAKSAAAQEKDPFADQYRRWLESGLSPKLARRNVARSLAATVWGLWKNGTPYRPEWVGVAAAGLRAAKVSL